MDQPFETSGNRHDRDRQMETALSALDPATSNPAYWLRFHGAVMSAARGELARRRMVSDVTVEEILSSWGRTLVPAAMLAVAMAGFLLFQGTTVGNSVDSFLGLDVEAMLAEGLEGEPIPAVVSSPEYPDADGAALFASETY